MALKQPTQSGNPALADTKPNEYHTTRGMTMTDQIADRQPATILSAEDAAAAAAWAIASEKAAGQPAAAEPPVVAYRNSHQPDVLLCREHGEGWMGLTALTSEDLPDGGICTWGRPGSNECGRDVLTTPAAGLAAPTNHDTETEAPFGCRWCGTESNSHGQRWAENVGVHRWEQPPQPVILDRMRARRQSRTDTLPALMASIQEYHALQQGLVDALRRIRDDMDRASKSGDEWAMEWLGDVWNDLPLAVRAAGGDQEAAHELAAQKRAAGAES